MSEHTVTATWLYTTLSGDATLASLVSTRIYDTVAPQGATLPYIIFHHQGGHDVRGATEATRIMSSDLYLVKMIAQSNSFTPVDTGEARIDALLHRKFGTAAGGTVVASYREQQHLSKYMIDGVMFVEKGGIYRILTQR